LPSENFPYIFGMPFLVNNLACPKPDKSIVGAEFDKLFNLSSRIFVFILNRVMQLQQP